jgi:hydrogenase maturation protease
MPQKPTEKILVYGIGNPYRCDDAVGIKTAEEIGRQIRDPRLTIKWGSIDGVAILDEIIGYDRVIFVDSVKTEKGKPGEIYRIKPPSGKDAGSFASHGINFITGLQFGKKFGLHMPRRVEIFAIEIEDNTSFSEECTPNVAAAIPKLAETILKEIDKAIKARYGN